MFAEKFRLRDEKKPPRFTKNANAMSVRLGTWLSRGLDATAGPSSPGCQLIAYNFVDIDIRRTCVGPQIPSPSAS